MTRPQRETQHVLLDRIAQALAARNDIRPWTLADIAPAAGLSPAGLIKRFGSRKGVLLALSRRWIDGIPEQPHGSRPARDELRAWVNDRFAPEHACAGGLTQLIDDLIDDDLRELLIAGWAREQRYLASLLQACELPGVTDPHSCAALLFDALNGASLRHATHTPHAPVRQNLETLMEMWT